MTLSFLDGAIYKHAITLKIKGLWVYKTYYACENPYFFRSSNGLIEI